MTEKPRVLLRKIIIIVKKENAYNNSKVFRWKRKTLIIIINSTITIRSSVETEDLNECV